MPSYCGELFDRMDDARNHSTLRPGLWSSYGLPPPRPSRKPTSTHGNCLIASGLKGGVQPPKVSFIVAEMAEDFEEAIRLGVDAGVNNMAVRSKIFGRELEDLSEAEVDPVNAVFDRYGVRVGEILTPVGKCDIENQSDFEDHLEVLRKSVRLAQAFGTVNVRVFPFRRAGYTEYEPSRLEEYLEHIVENLRPMVQIAETGGVILCFECVGSTLARTSQEIRSVVDALGHSDSVAFIWEMWVRRPVNRSKRLIPTSVVWSAISM
jgi:uncharacterized protein with GYD domain